MNTRQATTLALIACAALAAGARAQGIYAPAPGGARYFNVVPQPQPPSGDWRTYAPGAAYQPQPQQFQPQFQAPRVQTCRMVGSFMSCQ